MKNLIFVLLIPFLLVLTVQICLKHPKSREIFTDIEDYEDIDYGGLPQVDGVEIEFSKFSKEDVELYFNGEKIKDFNKNLIKVKVWCDGMFEIKNNSNSIVTITVASHNNKADLKIINTQFLQGISPICQVDIN